MGRIVFALAAACLVGSAGRADAGLITYTFSGTATGTATGTAGSTPFTAAAFTIAVTADTADVFGP